jgi:hypothetical protein
MDSGDLFMAHKSPPERELSESPLNPMNLGKTYFSSSDESGGRLSPILEVLEELNHTQRQFSNLSLNAEISNAGSSNVGSPSTQSDELREQVENEVEKEIQEVMRRGFQSHAGAMQGEIDKMRGEIDRIAINQNLLQAEMLDEEWEWSMFKTRRKYIVQVGKDGHDEFVSKPVPGAKYKRLAKEILRRCDPDNEAVQTAFGNKVRSSYHFQSSIIIKQHFLCFNKTVTITNSSFFRCQYKRSISSFDVFNAA